MKEHYLIRFMQQDMFQSQANQAAFSGPIDSAGLRHLCPPHQVPLLLLLLLVLVLSPVQPEAVRLRPHQRLKQSLAAPHSRHHSFQAQPSQLQLAKQALSWTRQNL
jgi:hypothetical protein